MSPVAAPVDTTAPVTTSDAQSTYVSIAAITLSATDGGSGVAATYYTARRRRRRRPAPRSPSPHSARTRSTFWSVDVAGNIESPTSRRRFTVTPPTAGRHHRSGDDVGRACDLRRPRLRSPCPPLTRGSGVAATYYTLDGGSADRPARRSRSPHVGSHTIEFWSVDVAGNIEAHKTATLHDHRPVPVLDTTAPVTTSDALATYVNSAAITPFRHRRRLGRGRDLLHARRRQPDGRHVDRRHRTSARTRSRVLVGRRGRQHRGPPRPRRSRSPRLPCSTPPLL